MTTSADLGIYYLAGQQAQPEIIHNSALNQFQILLSGATSFGLNTPPGSPAQGDTYVLGASPTGAWAGRANCLAGYFGTGWVFVPGNNSAGTPIAMGVRQEGLRVWNKTDDKTYVWNGSAWVVANAAQSGVANKLASGDYYLTQPHAADWVSSSFTATAVSVGLAYVDADMTVSALSINVVTAAASSAVDVALYQFLGCGKPGVCLASGTATTTTTGVKDITLGSPVALTAGVYFVVLHSTNATLAIASATGGTTGGDRDTCLILSDGFARLNQATEGGNYNVNDSSLPGGAYSLGMNLTGLTISTANATASGGVRRVALKKQ